MLVLVLVLDPLLRSAPWQEAASTFFRPRGTVRVEWRPLAFVLVLDPLLRSAPWQEVAATCDTGGQWAQSVMETSIFR